MLYALKIAWRYLTASLVQTGLLIVGVAVGVFVFIFMSALIGGLAEYLVDRTIGNIAHVTVEAPSRDPGLVLGEGNGEALLVAQKASSQQNVLRTAAAFLPGIAALPEVTATAQEIVGNGFLVRGAMKSPVAVTGMEAGKVSAIADIAGSLVSGTTDLPGGTVLIGSGLADDLGVSIGQTVTLQSDRGHERAMVVGGIYRLGLDTLDRRAAFISLGDARPLFDMTQGISRIEIKLDNLDLADTVSRQIAAQTGLKTTSWTQGNAQLLDGLVAQRRSGDLIKSFALITIVIGVASALLLSTYRRRPEIGIMRAMGASRGFVILVFVLQGTLIGLLGGLLGAGLGYLALSPFPPPDQLQSGGLPIDVRQGAFGVAIALTTLGAILASILPARSAARVDPVSAIGQ